MISVGFYEIIAIDANTADTNTEVTHPHVEASRLCEGDAQPTIRLALATREGCSTSFRSFSKSLATTTRRVLMCSCLSGRWYSTAATAVTRRALATVATAADCGTTVCYECIRECDTCRTFVAAAIATRPAMSAARWSAKAAPKPATSAKRCSVKIV